METSWSLEPQASGPSISGIKILEYTYVIYEI